MRAFLLASVFPALALALTACGQQPSETTTAEAPPPPPAAEAPATPAPPPPAAPAPAAPAAAPTQQAAAASEEDATVAAVKLRQGAMRLLSFANGPVGGMLRGTVPFDAAAAKQAADRVAVIAPMLPGVFATDTSAASGVETEALPAIWTNKADFDMKAANLLAAAQALSAAAATGDQAATMAAAGPVGQACGSCHDDYRAE